jgi:L-asparaginase II
MRAYPEMVAGPGGIDTVLMQIIPDFAAKRGAEGYYGIALRDSPQGPLGIALKVEDGSNQAREVFVIALLEHLGILSEKTDLPWRNPIVTNHRGIETGYMKAHLELAS